MKPKHFPGQNVILGENQPQYQDLPALCLPGDEAEVITCWEFSDEDWEKMSKNRCFYFSQLRFGRYVDGIFYANPLQPILPMAELGDNLKLNL